MKNSQVQSRLGQFDKLLSITPLPTLESISFQVLFKEGRGGAKHFSKWKLNDKHILTVLVKEVDTS